jgi:hypothetical protein
MFDIEAQQANGFDKSVLTLLDKMHDALQVLLAKHPDTQPQAAALQNSMDAIKNQGSTQ